MHTQDNLLSDFLKEAGPQDTLRAARAKFESRGVSTKPNPTPKPKSKPAPNPTPKPKPKPKSKPAPKHVGKAPGAPTHLKIPSADLKGTKGLGASLFKRAPSPTSPPAAPKPKGGKARAVAALLSLLSFGGGSAGTYAVMRKGDDEDVVDYGKAEEAAPTPEPEAPSGPDPVTYGAGGALLGGGVSHAWGKMAGRPDLARDLIAALGTGIAGATYAATRESNE